MGRQGREAKTGPPQPTYNDTDGFGPGIHRNSFIYIPRRTPITLDSSGVKHNIFTYQQSLRTNPPNPILLLNPSLLI